MMAEHKNDDSCWLLGVCPTENTQLTVCPHPLTWLWLLLCCTIVEWLCTLAEWLCTLWDFLVRFPRGLLVAVLPPGSELVEPQLGAVLGTLSS